MATLPSKYIYIYIYPPQSLHSFHLHWYHSRLSNSNSYLEFLPSGLLQCLLLYHVVYYIARRMVNVNQHVSQHCAKPSTRFPLHLEYQIRRLKDPLKRNPLSIDFFWNTSHFLSLPLFLLPPYPLNTTSSFLSLFPLRVSAAATTSAEYPASAFTSQVKCHALERFPDPLIKTHYYVIVVFLPSTYQHKFPISWFVFSVVSAFIHLIVSFVPLCSLNIPCTQNSTWHANSAQ